MKIINILHHTAPSSIAVEDVLIDGWQSRLGRQIKKHFPEVDVECWLPSKFRGEAFKKDQITFRTIHAIEPSFHSTICPSLLSELEKAQDKQTLVHVFGERSLLAYFLASMRRLKRVPPLVLHHLGAGGGRGYSGGEVVSSAFCNFESLLLPNADLIYTVSSARLWELNRFGVQKEKLRLFQWGVDLDLFRPIDKTLCREKLGLPQDKRIVLYVGRFSNLRGLGKVLRSVEQLRRKMDVELVAVGGSTDEPLWPLVKNKLAHYGYRIPPGQMPYYYNAADVFVWYVDGDAYMYAGMGVSPSEAFACGVPVVSNTLINSPEPISPQIGVIPKSPEELTSDIDRALTNANETIIRKYAERNLAWGRIAKSTMRDYNSIMTRRSSSN